MAIRGFLLLVIALFAVNICVSAQKRDPESELLHYLKNNISNFSPLLRPTLNFSLPIHVIMDTALSQIVSVESAKQSVRIGAFIEASWTEERLVWNPALFGGVNVINWDSSNIWFPVILVYNGIGNNQVLTPQLPVYLRSLRRDLTLVTAGWRREFEFSCDFDMHKFPVDKHVCDLEFFFSDQGRGNRMLIPVKNTGVYSLATFNTTGLYRRNSEWNLFNASTYAAWKSYSLVNEINKVLLPTYVIHLEIQRVSAYYFMNVITPLLLLTLLQVLVYFVPLESGEKLGFGITIMLSYTVFLLLLDNIVPKSQSTPAVISFITAALVLSTVSLLLTSLIMRLHFAPEGSRMSACMRAVLVQFLARLFCVHGATETRVKPANETDDEAKSESIGEEPSDNEAPIIRSDWVMAAQAVDRLTVVLGGATTIVIIGVFVFRQYV